jgi:hypothetical protein
VDAAAAMMTEDARPAMPPLPLSARTAGSPPLPLEYRHRGLAADIRLTAPGNPRSRTTAAVPALRQTS